MRGWFVEMLARIIRLVPYAVGAWLLLYGFLWVFGSLITRFVHANPTVSTILSLWLIAGLGSVLLERWKR